MNHSVELSPQSVVSTSNLDLCYPQPNSKGLGFRVNPNLEIFVRASAECRRCSCKAGSFGRGSSNEVEHRDQRATPRDARNQHALKSSASNPKGPKAQNLELSKVCSFRLACGKNLKQALRRLSQDSKSKSRPTREDLVERLEKLHCIVGLPNPPNSAELYKHLKKN